MVENLRVTHEKFVKCTSPLNQVGQYVRPHLWYSDRSAKGLQRPIGQSLIRALRHIIEFDSGLLITWISGLRLDHDLLPAPGRTSARD